MNIKMTFLIRYKDVEYNHFDTSFNGLFILFECPTLEIKVKFSLLCTLTNVTVLQIVIPLEGKE